MKKNITTHFVLSVLVIVFITTLLSGCSNETRELTTPQQGTTTKQETEMIEVTTTQQKSALNVIDDEFFNDLLLRLKNGHIEIDDKVNEFLLSNKHFYPVTTSEAYTQLIERCEDTDYGDLETMLTKGHIIEFYGHATIIEEIEIDDYIVTYMFLVNEYLQCYEVVSLGRVDIELYDWINVIGTPVAENFVYMSGKSLFAFIVMGCYAEVIEPPGTEDLYKSSYYKDLISEIASSYPEETREKSIEFIDSNEELFPVHFRDKLYLLKGMCEDIEFKHLAKNISPYLGRVMKISGTIANIEEFEFDGVLTTYIHLINKDYESFEVLYKGSIDVFNQDYISVIGTPVAQNQFTNVSGGITETFIIIGGYIGYDGIPNLPTIKKLIEYRNDDYEHNFSVNCPEKWLIDVTIDDENKIKTVTFRPSEKEYSNTEVKIDIIPNSASISMYDKIDDEIYDFIENNVENGKIINANNFNDKFEPWRHRYNYGVYDSLELSSKERTYTGVLDGIKMKWRKAFARDFRGSMVEITYSSEEEYFEVNLPYFDIIQESYR